VRSATDLCNKAVASAASFNIHRVYYDEQVEGQGDKLAKRLQRALKEKLH
jgi:hypothetical protein